MFLGEIPCFTGSKTLNQRFGANLKTCFLAKFGRKFLAFCVFQLFSTKALKIKISTSNCSGHPPMASQKIQHPFKEGQTVTVCFSFSLTEKFKEDIIF